MINRLMWRAIFISFSHPYEEVDSLTDVMFGISVHMLPDMENIVATTPAITGAFVAGEAYVVDALTDVLTVVIIGALSAIDVDTLAGENVNDLAAVMTPLEFTLPAPCEEPMPFC